MQTDLSLRNCEVWGFSHFPLGWTHRSVSLRFSISRNNWTGDEVPRRGIPSDVLKDENRDIKGRHREKGGSNRPCYDGVLHSSRLRSAGNPRSGYESLLSPGKATRHIAELSRGIGGSSLIRPCTGNNPKSQYPILSSRRLVASCVSLSASFRPRSNLCTQVRVHKLLQ